MVEPCVRLFALFFSFSLLSYRAGLFFDYVCFVRVGGVFLLCSHVYLCLQSACINLCLYLFSRAFLRCLETTLSLFLLLLYMPPVSLVLCFASLALRFGHFVVLFRSLLDLMWFSVATSLVRSLVPS